MARPPARDAPSAPSKLSARDPLTPVVTDRRAWWIEACLGVAAYLAAGAVVVLLKREYGTSLWYPPVVVGTAMLLRLGIGALPLMLAADLTVTWLQFGPTPLVVVPMSLSSALEAWVMAVLLAPIRGVSSWGPAASVRIVGAALASALAAATVGMIPLFFMGHPGAMNLRLEWFAWCVGDATAHMALVPVVLALMMRSTTRTERVAPFEYAVVLAVAALFGHWLGAGSPSLGPLRLDGLELLLLPVTWGAMRFRPVGAFGLLAWTELWAIGSLVTEGSSRGSLAAALSPPVLEAQLDTVVLSMVMLVTVTMREAQRASLARIAESEAELRASQRTARMGSWEFDLPDGEMRWSREMFRLLRLDPATTRPSLDLWLGLVAPADRERTAGRRAADFEPSPEGPQRRTLRLHDGSELNVELRIERRDHEDGRPRLVGTMADVSEAVALERRFLHAQRMESVGRLAGGVAHDFNNLLTVIRGFVDLLRLEMPAKGRNLAHLAEIERAADRGARLTGQLLAFSRRGTRDVRVVDLGALVGDFERGLRRLIGEDIHVQIEARPGVSFVQADAGQLEQVLLNLVVNARDAMPAGGTLRIRVLPPDGGTPPHVCLRVEDTGVGMDEATRDRIFEPFFTTKDAGKGTGLGLATVFGIVEQHGGRVTVESTPGRGARFDVHLPATSPPEARPEEPAVGTPAARGRGTLLVLEDDAGVRRYVREVLERHGYVVHTAADAAEARTWFEREGHGVDALVTDIVLPGDDGVMVARDLRAMRPGLPVLFMTGYLGEANEPATGDPVLRKPFRATELLARVTELVGQPQSPVPGA